MTARFLIGDVFDGLATLETGSVDLVVTSPPFRALRSYLPADHPLKGKEMGSEPTPAEFVDSLLRVTAELRRVLAPHGSICVELGDTYTASGGAGGDYAENGLRDGQPKFKQRKGNGWPLDKSKALIPELYRIALAYGINPLTGAESPAGRWRVRNTVTWCRPNPPVGALGDKWRPATSDVVIACTSGKRYWDDLATRRHTDRFDRGGLRKGSINGTDERRAAEGEIAHTGGSNLSGAPLLDYWEIPLDGGEPKPYGPKEKADKPRPYRTGPETAYKPDEVHSGDDRRTGGQHPAGSPLLDYWEIPPTSYSGSHYAVFPPALVEPLVKAMCPQRVCRVCGEPSRRIVSTEYSEGAVRGFTSDNGSGRGGHQGIPNADRLSSTVGWTDCGHDSWRPGLILDPFAGSGTTLLVATGHGHDAIGIDLDSRNADLAEARVGPFLFERVDLTQEPV